MTLIKKFLSKLQGAASDASTDLNDHYLVLDQLRKNHDWISVLHLRSQKSYQSMLMALDIENHELLIDELFPALESRDVDAGDSVQISAQSRRSQINFFSRILAREKTPDGAVLRLELPEEFGRSHSRGAYRVYVQNEENLFIELGDGEERWHEGIRIINLAADGIKLSLPKELEHALHPHKKLTDCLINLPSGHDIECTIELRNIYSLRSPEQLLLANGKLNVINPQLRTKLDQFLVSVQRQQRRRDQRLDD